MPGSVAPAQDRSERSSVAQVEALAVVVSVGTTPYLTETLTAVARQTRPPEVVLLVDAASRANGLGTGEPVEEAVEASGLDQRCAVRIVRAPESRNFGDAVRRGLAAYAALVATGNRRRRHHGAAPATGSATTGSAATGAAVGPATWTGPTGALSPITTGEIQLVGAAQAPPATPERHTWLWLLHDDSAPLPGCLEALLDAVTTARSVALAGPKQVDWDNPDQLLEVGLRTTASARRANDIVDGEVDQGQHDDRSDVLAVGTAGALIDRDVWEALGGTSPHLGPFGDGLELSRAVRLAGHRVVVVPTAVLRHRRASYLGLRPAPVQAGAAPQAGRVPSQAVPAAQPDPDRSFRARRVAQLTNWATFTPPRSALLLGVLLAPLGLARALWRLLTKTPWLADDELRATAEVLTHPDRVRAGRARLAARATVPRSVLTALYVDSAEIRAMRRDRRRQERERLRRAEAPSELEVSELAVLARRRRTVLGALLVLTAVMAAVALGPVLVSRAVTGGALTTVGLGWRDAWTQAWGTWVASGDGTATGPTPLLAVVALVAALVTPLGLGADDVLHLVVALALPLAALGAWFAAGTVTRRTRLRAWAALSWACAPALLLALGQGRAVALGVHLVLPWALVALARALGEDRRDLVLSGLVGAHHLTTDEEAELDRWEGARIEDLSHLDEDAALGTQGAEADVQGAEPASEPEGEKAGSEEAGDEGGDGSQDGAGDHAPDQETGSRAAADQATASREAVLTLPDGQDVVPQPASAASADPASADPASALDGPALDGPAARRNAASAAESYGSGSATAAAAAGLLLAVMTALAPATVVVVVPLLLLAALTHRGAALRLLLTLLPVLAVAAPTWWQAWQAGSGGAWQAGARLLLTEAGAPVAVAAPSPVEMLLSIPIDLESLGLPAAAALAVKATCAVVPGAALLGALATGRHGARARGGLLGALGGLALAALAVRTTTAVGTNLATGAPVLVPGWAGTGLSLALAGFLAAALAGADQAHTALPPRLAGWRRAPGARPIVTVAAVAAVAVSAVVLLAPALLGGAWALWAPRSDRPTVMSLAPATQQVPLIAGQTQVSDSRGKVLVLTSTPDRLEVSLWRGAGTQLTDVLPVTLTSRLTDTVADPAAIAPVLHAGATTGVTTVDAALLDPADAALADAVARAVAGGENGVADLLAAHGIAVVLVTDNPGDEATTSAVAGLDATDGLERLARTATGTSWRVTPTDATESARVVLVDAGAQTVTVPSGPTRVDTEIPASSDGTVRTLVLAERADGAWHATLDGAALEPTDAPGEPDGAWRQAFTVPAGGGHLVVTHSTTTSTVMSWVAGAVLAVTALAALPLRRRRSPR